MTSPHPNQEHRIARLKALVNERFYGRASILAKTIKMNTGLLSQYMLGHRPITERTIASIEQKLDIVGFFARTPETPVDGSLIAEERKVITAGLSPDMQALVDGLNALPAAQRIKLMAQFFNAIEPPIESPPIKKVKRTRAA